MPWRLFLCDAREQHPRANEQANRAADHQSDARRDRGRLENGIAGIPRIVVNRDVVWELVRHSARLVLVIGFRSQTDPMASIGRSVDYIVVCHSRFEVAPRTRCAGRC